MSLPALSDRVEVEVEVEAEVEAGASPPLSSRTLFPSPLTVSSLEP
jgi:hypothetical protein